jgi:hypothetical protein
MDLIKPGKKMQLLDADPSTGHVTPQDHHKRVNE